MKMIKLCALIFVLFSALGVSKVTHASSEWFCDTQSSERIGNEIKTCGIGIRENKAEAIQMAFIYSQKEFRMLCEASSDCREHKIIVTPMRTECKKELSHAWDRVAKKNTKEIHESFKCTRMISFTIGQND